jgi:hypothetical protein
VITPIFKLSRNERWRPQPAETAEQLGKIDRQPFTLANLPNGVGKRMDFPATMKDPTDTAVVGYHRVKRASNLHWHQFWLWYLYNPWSFAGSGVGRHEGDWEFVQLGCTDRKGDKPVLVTASQHRTGQKREFWRCELERGRPVIYVALGSHANFFSAGDRGQDKADGLGKKLSNIQWREFGDADPWTGWLGRWGNSTGPGRSPESPGCQGERWHAPDLYHAEAG